VVARILVTAPPPAPSITTRGNSMNISKDQIVQLLHGQGQHDQATQVSNAAPEQVDTDNSEHADLLSKLGVNLDDIKGKLGGLGKML
jgi:hypothetical protein